ncbi:hypothetical protein E4U53_004662, partial [Claviceps sorghi]
QKAAAESRYSATITGSEIAQNLKRLASQRHDVVDAATGQGNSEEELARRKRAAPNPAENQPETRPQPMTPQTVNVEEQIRAIHQKFAGDKKQPHRRFNRRKTAKLSGQHDTGRAADKKPTSPTSPPSAPHSPSSLHRPIMQVLPDTRQQSFDEIYGPPENFLEIEVRIPLSGTDLLI